MTIPIILRKTGAFLDKNSPVILTGLSLVGLVGTVAFAINATPKAQTILMQLEDEYYARYQDGELDTDKIPAMEIIKKVGPVYIPTMAMGVVTAACMVGATAIASRQNALLASLYSGSQLMLKEYQDKVVETFGEKEEKKVRDDIAHDRIMRNPVTSSEVFLTGRGASLCYDTLTGRYFTSDYESIRRSVNNFNADIISRMSCSVNEWFAELNLDPVDRSIGEELGWNVDHRLAVDFSSHVASDGRPCLVVDYTTRPRPRYEL